MTRKSLSCTITNCFIVAAMCTGASADTIFYDDFEDGARDEWEYTPDVPFVVDDGNLIVANIAEFSAFASASLDLDLGDTSVRTQARLRVGNVMGIIARLNEGGQPNGYYGVVFSSGFVAVGLSGWSTHLNTIFPTGLEPLEEDVVMQLDVIGDQIRFWAWPADETMPADPLVEATGEYGHLATGDVEIFTGIWGWHDAPVEAAFSYVQVANTHIPEPSTFTLAALGLAGLLTHGLRKRSLTF